MKGSYLIIYNLTILIFPISFLVSLVKTRKKTNHKYMNGFYWYSLIAMIIFVFYILGELGLISNDIPLKLNILSFIYHYYFCARFISRAVSSNVYDVYFKCIYYIFFGLTIITSISTTLYIEYRGLALIVANIGLIVLSLFYYNHLFEDNEIVNLYKEPSFWVITGIVLGMSINIPFQALSKHLILSLQEEITKWIFILGAFGYVLMHLFFIKASLLCSIQTSEK